MARQRRSLRPLANRPPHHPNHLRTLLHDAQHPTLYSRTTTTTAETQTAKCKDREIMIMIPLFADQFFYCRTYHINAY